MSATPQAEKMMKGGTGDAPVSRRLLLHPQEIMAQNTSPSSCPHSAESRPRNGFGNRNENEVLRLPIEKRAAMLRAASASGRASSRSRHQRSETKDGGNFHEATAPFSPISFRPPQRAPLVDVALEESVPCALTREDPSEERHFVAPSVIRPTSLLERSEAIAKMTQVHNCSSPPSLPIPSVNRAALVSLKGDPRNSVAAIDSSGEGEGDVNGSAGPATSVVGAGCFSVPLPPPSNRSAPAQFSRSEKSLWVATRNPNEGIVAADCNECTASTSEGSEDLISPCTPARVLHTGVEPDASQYPTMRIEHISTTPDKQDGKNSTTGGDDVAVADQCSHFDEAVKKVRSLNQTEVVVPQNCSPPPASLPLHRTGITLDPEKERQTAVLTASFESSRVSATAEATPPNTRWCKEISWNMSSLRHSNIENPATPQGQAVFGAGDALHMEKNTPDKVQGAPRPQAQGGCLHEQGSSNVVDDYLSTVGKRDFRKHGSPSSGRGAGSSYGCSDGGSMLESHQACHFALDSPADMEDDAHGSVASLNNIESLAQDRQEAAQQHHCRSAEDVVAFSGVGGAGTLMFEYALPPVCQDIPSTRPSDTHADETVDLRDDDMKPFLERGIATLAEFSLSTLTAFMTACQDAWLPPIALTGLPRAVLPMHTPPLAVAEASATSVSSSEMSLLFRLYCRSPSERSAERLVEIFFDTQRMRYVNWVNHLCFEYLYLHMVALRAVSMLEVHHRRLTCMLRDLCIRDTIELFMLLLPRPRAPKTSSRRSVFSAFRIALHALGGDSRKREVSVATKKSQGSCHVSRQPQPSSSAAPPSAPLCRLTAFEDEGYHQSLRVEPLFASEHCYPIQSTDRVLEADSCVSGGRNASGISAPVSSPPGGASDTGAEVSHAVPETKNTDNSIQDICVSRRGIPRPLNRVYQDYHLLAAKKARRSGASSTLSSASSWLPSLRMKASQKASVIPNTTARSDTHCVACFDDYCTSTSQHLLEHDRAKREHASKALVDGEQYTEEWMLPHKCDRSTQLTTVKGAHPDFLNLFDADTLKEFAP